jgi:hypothetical protein
MYKALKGFLIFAAMVALPLVWHNLASGHDRAPVSAPAGEWILAIAILLAAGLAIAFGLKMYTVSEDIEVMIGCLTLAERDFNNIINSGWDQTGRLNKAKERAAWTEMGHRPNVQTLEAGYRTVAHDAFDANQADLKSRGQTMGKAGITAFLLRELYEGHVAAAKSKVEAEYRNGADTVYIAPGIDKLIGYDASGFDNETRTFRKKAGVNRFFLKAAVDIGGFPKDVAIVKTEKIEETVNGEPRERAVKTVVRGLNALEELVQQGRPPEPSSAEARAAPVKSKFWRIAKAIIDDVID